MPNVRAIEGPINPGLHDRISTLVRMLMARDGYTQEQLAARIGMDQVTLSARLRGRRRWSVEDLDRLGEVFQVHPGAFWADPKDIAPSPDSAIARPASTGWLTARAA
jgi:transcriptional regulator with XRE-family HTH domain